MTRKHYELIADAITSCTNGVVCIDKSTFIDTMIDIFKADNDRFNKDIFIDRIETNSGCYSHSLDSSQLKRISNIMKEVN